MLKKPLGQWLVSGPKLHRSWPMYYDPTDKTLEVKTSTGYTQYLKELDSLKFVDDHEIQWEMSLSALPVHAATINGSVTYTLSHLPVVDNEILSSQQLPAMFAEYISQLPCWERALFQELDMKFDCYSM
eukprot:4134213-Ditylum_brightwellii.AAC.1